MRNEPQLRLLAWLPGAEHQRKEWGSWLPGRNLEGLRDEIVSSSPAHQTHVGGNSSLLNKAEALETSGACEKIGHADFRIALHIANPAFDVLQHAFVQTGGDERVVSPSQQSQKQKRLIKARYLN